MAKQHQIELGTAGANIAGNIDVLLPQLAERGAEVAAAGNQIHEKVFHLREISLEFIKANDATLQPVAFDKVADEISAILPQLANHGADVQQIAVAIGGYVNQLKTVHAQHLHLFPGDHPVVVAPHVNNGLGGAPFQTGTAVVHDPADTSKIDPVPAPAGDGH